MYKLKPGNKYRITISFPLKERIKQVLALLLFGEVRLWESKGVEWKIKKIKHHQFIDFVSSPETKEAQ